MRKIILSTIIALAAVLTLTNQVLAANLSVRLEQPKSPTNQNTFGINFVALDIQNRAITVECFKKGPGDSAFTQFGADINLIAGGNTGNCGVTSSIVSAEGTYQFYVTATAGAEPVDSSIISVDYKTSGPGTPTNYSKEKVSDCDYKIKFRTADDGGKTVKVDIYRSENLSFGADVGNRVAIIAIGSNQDGSFDNFVPDCSKSYYYAIRAFDNVGNGSGVVGDSVTKTVTTNVVITPTPGGETAAIPAGGTALAGSEGQILGGGATGTEEAKPEAGEEAKTEEDKVLGTGAKPTNFLLIGLGVVLLGLIAFWLYRRLTKEE